MGQNGKLYRVVVSDRAKEMLEMHIRFMAQVNKTAAAAKKRQLMSALRSLETMPERFQFFEAPYVLPNKYRKMFVEKYYLVLYQVRESTVYVDYILDCRKDYRWLL